MKYRALIGTEGVNVTCGIINKAVHVQRGRLLKWGLVLEGRH